MTLFVYGPQLAAKVVQHEAANNVIAGLFLNLPSCSQSVTMSKKAMERCSTIRLSSGLVKWQREITETGRFQWFWRVAGV